MLTAKLMRQFVWLLSLVDAITDYRNGKLLNQIALSHPMRG